MRHRSGQLSIGIIIFVPHRTKTSNQSKRWNPNRPDAVFQHYERYDSQTGDLLELKEWEETITDRPPIFLDADERFNDLWDIENIVDVFACIDWEGNIKKGYTSFVPNKNLLGKDVLLYSDADTVSNNQSFGYIQFSGNTDTILRDFKEHSVYSRILSAYEREYGEVIVEFGLHVSVDL